MTTAPTLTTPRLRLRAPAEVDIDPIVNACQDPDIQRFTLVPVPYRRTDAEFFVHRLAVQDDARCWTIETLGDDGDAGAFVGIIGLHRPAEGGGGGSVDGGGSGDGDDVAGVGYWCVPEHRGRGYLGEALRAVVEDAFTPAADGGAGLRLVFWSALVGNIASARLACSAGFRYTGTKFEDFRDRDRGVAKVHTAELCADDDRTPQHWPVLDRESGPAKPDLA
ncbi:GNAT family N-acetyltransferase [Gordonia aurantiaca]|uniref:GNAT family N-acetyltransferase n=1 Tax=Gordonia sp. B21 TaxID=3151852 RepID=UPI003266C60D